MKRAARPGPRVRRLLPLLPALLALAGGCRGRPPTAEVGAGRTLPLAAPVDSAASIAAAPGGGIWLVSGGRLALLDTARAPVPPPVELGTADAARVVGSDTAAVYLRAGSRLLAVWPDSGRVRARRGGVGADGFASGPRGGGFVATRWGGVLGVAPGSLRPLWSWPERGPPGTALAVSPLGDRVYQALGGDEPRILTRDAQTGRILDETETGAAVRSLDAGPDGTLYAVGGEGRRAVLTALRPGPAGLAERWDVALRSLEVGDSARVLVSPAGTRVALVSREGEGTLRVLDAATGRVASGERGVLDAAFAADGSLLVLTAREVRIVRP